MHSATYSPDDNKLRLYPAHRLDAETYARVKGGGFKWAPRQELFVAPMWTPDREDLLLELAGEIEDEDKSLAERAEERSDRFEEYSEHRAADADRARKAVSAIADGIPLGQPILVGHHSERHARRDAEKIQNGMRKAVRMWEQSAYWTARAAGAVRHAKYHERPDVRARRIKTLEAEQRKIEKTRKRSAAFLAGWRSIDKGSSKKADGTPATPRDVALYLANHGYISYKFPLADYPRDPPASQYEGDMSLWSALNDNIVTAEQARELVIPGFEASIRSCDRWLAHLANRLAYERAMLADAGGTAADKSRPEKGGGCRCWASPGRYNGGWSYIQKVNQVSVTVLDNWGNGGRNFTRTIPFDKLHAVMTKAEVDEARASGRLVEAEERGFFLRDAPPPSRPDNSAKIVPAEFEAMKQTLKAGVKVVAAPQLFPTPPELAARMVDKADIRPGMRVLEPSAGTGNLLAAMPVVAERTAVEINGALADRLRPLANAVHCGDFLELEPPGGLEREHKLGQYDRVVMNPPFENGSDIKHILHALKFLKPGGRLVALCANGPRQGRELGPVISTWEPLESGTFKAAGTNVNVALLTIER